MKLFTILLIVGSILFPTISTANHHIRTQDINDICTTKTSTIRSVSASVKRAVYRRDGVPNGNHTGICSTSKEGCEVDHRVALWLGGSNDKSNLMIQPYDRKLSCNAHDKDDLEKKLHYMICSNQIDVKDAQDIIYNDWKSGYKKFINANGCYR